MGFKAVIWTEDDKELEIYRIGLKEEDLIKIKIKAPSECSCEQDAYITVPRQQLSRAIRSVVQNA